MTWKGRFFTILINLLYSLSLSYILFNYIFVGRIDVQSLFYASVFSVLSLIYGYMVEDLKLAFLGYVASAVLSVILTVVLVRLPIQMNIGSLAAELVTIYSSRNALMYILMVVTPLSLIFIPIGIYLSTIIDGSKYFKVGYFIFTLLLFALLINNYIDYSLEVYSIKLLEIDVEDIQINVEVDRAFLNLTYSVVNRGARAIEFSMIVYKVYFGGEVARVYSENFYGSPLVSRPLETLRRTVMIEVPIFKLKRNVVNGVVKASLVFEVYVKTRFGNTPVTFQHTTLLNVSQP